MSQSINLPSPDTKASKKTPALSHTSAVVLCAMFIVLTYLFTMIQVNPLGIPGGLIHLGNIPMFIAAILFGKKVGAISGGVGMALFDILSPYAVWAPFTLVIGLATGFLVGWISEHHQSFPFYLLTMLVAAVVKVSGYYFAEVIIYGNWIAPFAAVPANLTQVVVAAIVVAPLLPALKTAAHKILSNRSAR